MSPEEKEAVGIKSSAVKTKIDARYERILLNSIGAIKKGLNPDLLLKVLIEKNKIPLKDARKIVWKAVGIVTEELERKK